ncbi:MAG TPA: (2Fe-2S)-binding protein [Hypericibacter adhaerens]|jgi:isoquinoline 1-oxidoreductase alpha subunit|uniref:(2Fe-2S)-binding protein n=1 Tax=Hypericibacter adhaerens TaxID=2602016 RepID=UPI002CEC3200|nr:(2Fe-2S)-binding protein [Hypericibacter adhaerens]HWA41705.1 (2Fe-2S)-binding protein [Hypericibacter adhaerens]
MITLKVNGETRSVDVDPQTPLLWVLRDTIGLTGTKYGCGIAFCGACTVHLDGQPTRSCSIAVGDVGESAITTIEAVEGKAAKAVQTAWQNLDVVQCGYCQSGQVMAATALLAGNAKPTDADIDAAMTNICRCATYQRIRAAIHEAARLMEI